MLLPLYWLVGKRVLCNTIPAFQTKGVHCLSKAKNYDTKGNVLFENKLDSKFLEGLGVQNTCTELMPDSKKVVVVIRNISARNITIPKGTVVANICNGNKVQDSHSINQSVQIRKGHRKFTT